MPHDHDSAEGLLPLDAAKERVLSRITPLAPIELRLQEAPGCVIARDVEAPEDMPAFASSAMDGFAVRSEDVVAATSSNSVELRIAGRARIGRRPDATVGKDEAIRIDTGAPIPAGADCVVPIEQCLASQDTVRVLDWVPPGKHVRPAGEDARKDDLLVPAGRRIGGPELGLLAAAGCARVLVHPKPRVVVISTGDELVDPGEFPQFGQVRDANAYTLFGSVREAGASPFLAGIVEDDVDSFRETILSHMLQADAFISSGGVSVGEHDVVKRAFFRRGEVDFFRVAMQPGMPQAFGTFEGKPYFGLPGNPVSAFVSFEVFARPALLKLAGRTDLERPTVWAVLDSEISGPEQKTVLARVRLRRAADGYTATSTGSRSSNLLRTVARANGLAVLPPGVERLGPGERCRVILFRRLED